MPPSQLYSVMHAYHQGRYYALKYKGYFGSVDTFPAGMIVII